MRPLSIDSHYDPFPVRLQSIKLRYEQPSLIFMTTHSKIHVLRQLDLRFHDC